MKQHALSFKKNITKKDMPGMLSRMIVMIGTQMVVTSRMTTTFTFYLMTLLHLMQRESMMQSRANYDY